MQVADVESVLQSDSNSRVPHQPVIAPADDVWEGSRLDLLEHRKKLGPISPLARWVDHLASVGWLCGSVAPIVHELSTHVPPIPGAQLPHVQQLLLDADFVVGILNVGVTHSCIEQCFAFHTSILYLAKGAFHAEPRRQAVSSTQGDRQKWVRARRI